MLMELEIKSIKRKKKERDVMKINFSKMGAILKTELFFQR